MGRDSDDVPKSDFAFLEGRLLRVESEQRSIRRIHDLLGKQVEGLSQELRRFREDNDRGDPWRENTDVRNQRRVEMESLRARARDAEQAETALARQKAAFFGRLAIIAPAIGTLLFALAELVRSFIHH